jgi:dolichol-phosphate mannosyltransferase
MKISIVVPCYNEEDNIEKLKTEFFPVIESLIGRRLPDGNPINSVEVIFVDDGSKDETYDLLKKMFGSFKHPAISFLFEKHTVNRGLGAAIRTGFEAMSGDIVVTTDSDGTYQFVTIPHLLEYLKNDISIVTASPYHPKGEVVGVPGYRIFLSRGSSMIYRVFVNWNIYTYTALFRAYRKDVVDSTPFAANDFLGGTELMVKAMLKGYRVEEYPAALHSRVFGVSKAKLLRTIISHVQFQAKVLLHRLHIRPIQDGG